ncbi:MAG: PorT family protein [Pyrinomonadaceae bacterium]|nr:PorT family protein [Sphingobacteriaceae bacterium]
MKFLSMALATVMMISTASAQHVNFGVKAGLNLYNIKDEQESEFDSKVGFHIGALAHIHLNKQWALQPELVFSGQGAKFTSGGDETKLNLGYLNVPVMVQYMFDNGLRLQAGPQVGFLLSAKAKNDDDDIDVKDDLKPVDFSLGFGAGYVHVPSGFGVDARYNLGLSDINEEAGNKSTNQGFQLGVFYLFKHRN